MTIELHFGFYAGIIIGVVIGLFTALCILVWAQINYPNYRK